MSKYIEISSIIISPTRQRRHFEAARLHEFGDNIARTFLQNPIVLREVPGGLQLVSGERRLRAIADLAALGIEIRHDGQTVPLGFIPYTLPTDLTSLEAEEAELDENLHREDLTWQEQSAAHLRLRNLRLTQAKLAGTPAPTVADLAIEVRGSADGINQENTRRELIVAEHLNDPEVAAAKSASDAFKLLRRKEASEKDRALGALVGRTFTAALHQAINADALSWLAECPAEQFDVILTDTPYGMGADEFGDSGGMAQGAHGYSDTTENFNKILCACVEYFSRITKPQAHLYWFCDLDQFTTARESFSASGWWVFRTPLIWYKRTAMRAPWPEYGPQRKYEMILYAVKGKRPALKMASDVLDYPSDTNLGHAAQKPVALFQELLSRSVHPGDEVLDPFCGTGPIFAAAHALKCKATGVEIDTASYGISVKRIEQLKAQLELGI